MSARRSCQNEDGSDDPNKGTQLVEVYAMEIQARLATQFRLQGFRLWITLLVEVYAMEIQVCFAHHNPTTVLTHAASPHVLALLAATQ